MATYKYTQYLSDGNEYGYVKYNIKPDIGSYILAGDLVTITGVAKCTEGIIHGMQSYAVSNSGTPYESVHFKRIEVNIPKNTEGEFSISFIMPELSEDYAQGRTKNMLLIFDLFWTDRSGYSRTDYTVESESLKLVYLTYKLTPKITSVEFDRYSLVDGNYVSSDEGMYVLGKLKLGIDEGRGASDITYKRVTVTRDDGIVSTINLSSSVISSALTSSGYIESVPSIFSSMTFDTAYNYVITFTIGDTYNNVSSSVSIARAFANMHLSGSPIGGVAFGKFAAAGLFECNYPAYFYNGINISGTPWTDLPVASSVTTPDPNNNGDGKLRYIILGGMVFIRGGINVKPESSAILIATLPSGYRPSGTIYRAVVAEPTTGTNAQYRRANFYIDSNGRMYLFSVTNESGTKYTSAAIWIDCAMSFAVDD